MPRRRVVGQRKILPDPKFGSELLAKFINVVMVDGKKPSNMMEQYVIQKEYLNERINQCGGWFFQVKEASDGTFKLLEVASRIAGTSAITRCLGVNIPLLTVELFDGKKIEKIVPNSYEIELDRALSNSYKTDLSLNGIYLIELFSFPDPPKRLSYPEAAGLRHLAEPCQ